ncbi:MAG: Na-K-Cl cotransporter [Synechocystis sp.]
MPQNTSSSVPNKVDHQSGGSKAGLGTFGGVFTPSILTILGVIMYLRFGCVLGQVGLWQTLLIVTLSTAITFLTGLSIAAIATDQVVKAGGAYYMISRSLGIETGGAVGVPLYFAQAFSVALYTLGFAESVVRVMPGWNLTLVGGITTIAVTLLALKSAQIAIRAQYIIMAAIALSLLCLIFGHPATAYSGTVTVQPHSAGFWTVLAVFFPAVTGIMAGVNMSGDLRDPQKSIPWGTLAAIVTGYGIYILIPVILHFRADPITLLNDPLVMRRIALWGDSVLLGVWGATLSSAIGSIMGAPRILQALARDNILPPPLRWLGRGEGAEDEPRLGTLFTLGIALAAVGIGDLNLLAPILTMFFLTTYMVLNIAAGVEGFLQSPSFRPSFRVHWGFSLAGAVGCIAIMFLINVTATIVAAAIVLGVYLWLERQELACTWGDVRQGMWMTLVRSGLMNMTSIPDPKNWRPHLLVFAGNHLKRWHLVELAAALTHNRGLVSIFNILPPDISNPQRQDNLTAIAQTNLDQANVQAFFRVKTAPDLYQGMEQLVETYGLGPLIPNTVLVGHPDDLQNLDRYCQFLVHCHHHQRNVIILRDAPAAKRSGKSPPESVLVAPEKRQSSKRIDVWWGGLQSNGGLMLILAYLLRNSWQWHRSEICLKLVVPDVHAVQSAQANLAALVQRLRIGAIPQVINAEGRPFAEILLESSQDADFVLLGLAHPDDPTVGEASHPHPYAHYYQQLHERTQHLPATLFVLASEDLNFAQLLEKE